MIYIVINFKDEQKKCEIWITSQDKNYKESEEYIETINKCQQKKYSVCVFIGGTKPLLSTISKLLEIQTKSPVPFL